MKIFDRWIYHEYTLHTVARLITSYFFYMYTVKTGNELFQTPSLDIARKIAMIDKKKKLKPIVYSQETPESPKVFEFSL